MTALPITPSTDLLQVGKGIAVFKPVGSSTFYDMGNAPEIEITPNYDTLDHFSSRTGTKTRDLRLVIQKILDLRIVMDEWSPKNLAMMFGGTIDESDPEAPIIHIGNLNKVSGEFRLYGMNDVGPKYTVIIPSIDFIPSAGLNLISEEFGTMEVTGAMNADENGSFGTMTPRDDTGTAPVNIAAPQISGGNTQGDTLTASNGTWLGSPTSFTYQWNRNGSPISLATNATYVLTAPDIHASITVSVSATNANGSASATSPARVPTAY